MKPVSYGPEIAAAAKRWTTSRPRFCGTNPIRSWPSSSCTEAGAGKAVSIFTGTNQIGRGDDMRVQINFGDDTISRQQHAVITFDTTKAEVRIYDGGKPGGLWVNGTRVTADQAIRFGDLIKLGETTLRLEQP